MTKFVLGFDNPPHIIEWYKILDNQEYRKIVIAGPRGHAKSAVFSQNYPLQEIARNCNVRILIVSRTLSQAQLHLRIIKSRIERDPNYREYAGDLVPKYPEKWTEREIIVARTNLELKDATISTVGIGGAILARRADIIICDDVLGPENTRTLEQRMAVKRWFYEVLMPVLEPKTGRIVFIGTMWHKDDLLNELLKDPSYDFRKKYKAIISDSERMDLWDRWVELLRKDKKEAQKFLEQNRKEMYRGVKVLWEERFPYETLYLLRKENRAAFEKMYQNEWIPREEQEVKEEWIRYYDVLPAEKPLWQGTGVDLAISKKETADYTAMVSGKLYMIGGTPKIYVMPNPVNERLSGYETNEKARSVSLALGGGSVTPLWVEDVAYQKRAIEEMVRIGLPAEGVKVSTDKRARLRTVSTYIQNGTVLFPRRGCEDLISQLTGFGAEAHDDLMDAFVFMVLGLIKYVAKEPKLTII